MSAHGDDLRHFYAEHLGVSETLDVVAGSSVENVEKLPPGRYMVQFHTVSGAAICFVRQSKFGGAVAAQGDPSTPFDLGEDPKPRFYLIVRPGRTDQLSFRTDAGTVNAVITKISRDAH